MELPRDPPWPWLTPNKLETPTAREIMLFSPRQAESCSSLVTHHGLGSRLMREGAFTAATLSVCVDFVRTRIHPSELAAQPPPCTRPPNACCMRTRTAQSFFTTTPELLQPRDPPWPWLTLNAARRSFQHGGLPQRQRCIECINTSVACFYSPNRGNQRHEIL